MPDEADEDALARDIIEVHGVEASGVARANARSAALTGAIASAKRWIRVLEMIQRRSVEKALGENTPVRCTVQEESYIIISLASSRDHGFKKWSDAHKQIIDPTDFAEQSTVVPRNRDPDVVAHAVTKRLRGPWLVPGVGSSI
jgi:hypothetical protein